MKNLRPNRLSRMALFTLLIAAASIARANIEFNVTTIDDLIDDNTADGQCHTSAGNCSLRAAIMQSNHMANATILLIRIPVGIYLITRPIAEDGYDGEEVGDLDLTSPPGPTQTLVLGAGAGQTIIDGNQLDRVFNVYQDRVVTVDGLTVRNGSTGASGGGVFVNGSLTMTNCTVEGNHARSAGGGISTGLDNGGTVNLLRSTLRSNQAELGGGLAVLKDATLRDSTLEGNVATATGGAIYNAGQLVIANSTISGNVANTDAGGIFSRSDAFLYNTSVINNDADHDRDDIGGISGGVYVYTDSRFVAVNSLFSGNTILDSPTPDNCNGVLELYGKNLFDEIQGCTFTGNGGAAWDFVAGNSIGPLQDNGGPTRTHALRLGSEAIDATNAQGCIDQTGIPMSFDQRGASRVTGLRCDVGAFEYGSIADRIFQNGFD